MVKMMLLIFTESLLLGSISALTQEEMAQFYGTGTSLTINGDTINFKSKGTPDHDYGPFPAEFNPNEFKEQDHSHTFPANPTVASTPSCLPMGIIGYAINGIPSFNPFNAEGENAVEGSTKETFDSCDGHPQQSGVYHYHKIPGCLYNDSKAEQLLGVALDGFPIFSPVIADGTTLTPADLDECNGRHVNGKYRYHMTTTYPYIIGCYKGTPHKRCRGPPPGGSRDGRRPPPPRGNGDRPRGGDGMRRGGGGGCFFANKNDWDTATETFTSTPKTGENPVDMECSDDASTPKPKPSDEELTPEPRDCQDSVNMKCSASSLAVTLVATLLLSVVTALNYLF